MVVRFIGYHGTSATKAAQIRKNGFAVKSTGPHQWLGEGYYFFENARSWAEWWNSKSEKRKNYGPNSWQVIEADICVEEDRLIDLLDLTTMLRFERVRADVIRRVQKMPGPRFAIRSKGKKTLDALFIEAFCRLEGDVEVVRAAFPPEKLYDEIKEGHSRLQRIHIQLCCRVDSCITIKA